MGKLNARYAGIVGRNVFTERFQDLLKRPILTEPKGSKASKRKLNSGPQETKQGREQKSISRYPKRLIPEINEESKLRYLWKDSNTKTEVEVQRAVKDYLTPPDKDEAVAAGMEVEDFAEANWIRIIAASPIHRSGAWGSKGNI